MPEYSLNIKVDNLSESKEEKNKQELKKINNPSDKKEEDNIEKLNKTTNALVAKAVLNDSIKLGSQSINAVVSTIGAREDNIAKQNKIQNIMNIGSDVVNSTISTITSFAINPKIGAITLASDILSRLLSVVTNIENYKREQIYNTLESNRSIERLGNICTNRNR